ncbi:MAG: hypothetical protein B6I25_07230 [Planctomycetales bacterium 4572_13]|nr:MAG: hypothetical protein B6I25_07230 [Planctomycetales bacterium 4572_13]
MSIIGKFEKRIMYPLADFMHGTTITGHLAMLKQQQQLSHSEIVSIQDQKLSSLLNHSYEKVSYWRNLFDKCGLKPLDIKNANDLSRIAILNKSILRTKLSSLICKPPKGGKLKEQFSSGSTGEPVKYYTDNEAYSWRMAFMFLLWDWAGYEFGQKWCRISMWERNSIKDKLQDVLSRCLYISIAKFNQDVLEKYKLKIEKFRPAVIRGYAGALYLIADYLKKIMLTMILSKPLLLPATCFTLTTVKQ